MFPSDNHVVFFTYSHHRPQSRRPLTTTIKVQRELVNLSRDTETVGEYIFSYNSQ